MSEGHGMRVVREAEMHLPAGPQRVFPLLCPVRETEWIPTWEARIVFTESGCAEAGCVFTTPSEHGGETVWTVSRYEPGAGIIEFVVVVPEVWVMKLDIALHAEGEGTRAEWRRTFTALSEAGARALAAMTPEASAAHAAGLEAQLAHYLTSGTALAL